MQRAITTVLALMIATGAFAQTERFLVPLYLTTPVQGAYGSRWVSELRILNAGTTQAIIDNYGSRCPTECVTAFQPDATANGIQIRGINNNTIPAALLYINTADASAFRFQASIRDTSREDQRWGTWIPVVRETTAPYGTIHITHIPIRPNYRLMLRIYAFSPTANQHAIIRFYNTPLEDPITATPDPLLLEQTLNLTATGDSQPAYAQLPELQTLPGLDAASEVRITITPTDTKTHLWGMVSVTNNATQDVTMIIPNP